LLNSLSRSSSEPLIVRFYDPNVKAKDSQGRTLESILQWEDVHLEHSHDYIQMIFPLPEGSMFSFNAPIIDNKVMTMFRSRADLRQRLSLSLDRMLQFYGFQVSSEPPEEDAKQPIEKKNEETREGNAEETAPPETDKAAGTDAEAKGKEKEGDTNAAPSTSLGYYIVRGKNWQPAFRNWAKRMDHNHLRITRILRSLRILGLQKECDAFFAALQHVYNDPQISIGPRSMEFWERAVKQPLHIAPDGERVQWLKKWEVDQSKESE
jgi:hypothetical protein